MHAQAGEAPQIEVPTPDQPGEEANELAVVLEGFLATVIKLANAYAGAVRSLTDDGDTLRLIAAVGLSPEAMRDESLVGSCGVCGEAARCDGVHVASDASGCDKLGLAGFFGKPCSGTVAVPLEYKGHRIGVFTLFFEGVNQLRPEVIHLLGPIGQLLGLALENARLEQDKRRASIAQERRVIAGEIHDSLAQSLTFVRMRMPLLEDAIESTQRERALAYCADMAEELNRANRRLRELITHFRTRMDVPGLHRALAQAAATFQAQTGIPLAFESHAPDLELPPEREVEVYHILREALANVRKHSGAKHARLTIDRIGTCAVFAVEDDGAGVPMPHSADRPADGLPHFGFDIMRQRARSIGGRIDVENLSTGGARVCLTVPAAPIVTLPGSPS